MPNRIIILIFCLLVYSTADGQNGNYTMGARSAALANASVTLSDEWSVFNNVGALSYVESTSTFATYKNLFGLSEISTMAVGFTMPVLNGTMGLGAFRYGGDLFNEQRIHAGFSNRFGLVSLGAAASYYQLNIEGGGTRKAFMFDFGGHAKLSEQFYFGAHISNINQAKISEVTGERIPTYMKTGLSYRPNENVMINAEVEKSIDEALRFKFGLEYEIIASVFIRTGIITKPFNSNFGIGFDPGRLSVDYAYGNHSNLGDIHQFSFVYRIKK